MSSEFEDCRKSLVELISWYKSNKSSRNEATTRLHLIDYLLFQCLGWDKRSDCRVEESYGGKYTDYELFCPRRTVIVEAKKEGTYFQIPSGYSNKQYNIEMLKKYIPTLGDAIIQAANYCQTRGAPFGVVTNGHQVVAFIGNRQDGIPPGEGRALVFSSLNAILDDFNTFWNMLSKSGLVEENLLRVLLDIDMPILPRKLSNMINGFPGVKNRNFIQSDLHILSDLVFEDLISSQELEDEFLNKCYCKSGALSKYALISKRLLSTRYSSLFDNQEEKPALVPATTKKGISNELIAESFSKRPILILGDVGVGKTMFFRHFIKIDAKDVFDNVLVLYIDFGRQAAFSKVSDFIINELSEQLIKEHSIDIYEYSFVTAVYHLELIRFSKGIYGDLKESDPISYKKKEAEFLEQKLSNKEKFLQDALKHISYGRKQQIVLFLDNADQRNDLIQQEVFIAAQTISASWSVAVFLALRPETFQRSKLSGSLSGYHLKAFTISPPRIDEVLKKRLRFGLEITSGKLPMSSLPPSVSVDFKKVGDFLRIVLGSLEQFDELVECLDNLSGSNVRLALEFVRRLIGSGHINTLKILDILTKSGSYYIRLHELLRTIIYGDNIYYDRRSSPLENLFDIETLDKKEHFLSLILLQLASSEAKSFRQHGFIDTDKIYDFAQGLGFTVFQINKSIARLCDKKLLETIGRVNPIIVETMKSAVRITTIGAYHLEKLPSMFVYYDAVVTDTPVLIEEYRNQIRNVSDINDRLERGEIFLKYLNECYKNLDNGKCRLDWPFFYNNAKRNINDIKKIPFKKNNHSK